jgi:hypothetical protein
MYFQAQVAEGTMVVKLIARVTYWLGTLCFALALGARVMNALGFEMTHVSTRGNPIDFHSFIDGAVLSLLVSMASSLYSRLD